MANKIIILYILQPFIAVGCFYQEIIRVRDNT
jgi:hypothetical protein